MNTYSEDKMYESYSSEVERMQKCIDELQQENKQLKRIIKENTILVKDEYGDYQECNINPLRMKQKYEKQVDNWNKLKEYINKMHKYFLYTDVNEIYKQSMKEDNSFPNLFNLSELNASDRVLNSICKKIQELEQGSDSK